MSTTNVNNPWRVTPQICADLRTLLVQLHNAYLRDDQRGTARHNSALWDAGARLRVLIDLDPDPQYYATASAAVTAMYQLARTTAASPYETGTAAEQAQAALSQLRRLESLLD